LFLNGFCSCWTERSIHDLQPVQSPELVTCDEVVGTQRGQAENRRIDLQP
jgi:hypothetical protein